MDRGEKWGTRQGEVRALGADLRLLVPYLRVWVPVIPCAAVFFLVWRRSFSEVPLFLVLWLSTAAGSICGLPIGIAWFLWRGERRTRAAILLLSLLFLGACGLFAYGMLVEQPSMVARQNEVHAIRALAEKGIVRIEVITAAGRVVHIEDQKAISLAKRCFGQAVFVSHAPTVEAEVCTIRVRTEGESFEYAVEQAELDRHDEIYTFWAHHASVHIRFPGLHDWLEEWAKPLSAAEKRKEQEHVSSQP